MRIRFDSYLVSLQSMLGETSRVQQRLIGLAGRCVGDQLDELALVRSLLTTARPRDGS